MPNASMSDNDALEGPYANYWAASTQRENLVNRIERAKSAYSVRRVDLSDVSALVTDDRPSAGDLVLARVTQSWLGESEQDDKWLFCLTAAMIAAHQERS